MLLLFCRFHRRLRNRELRLQLGHLLHRRQAAPRLLQARLDAEGQQRQAVDSEDALHAGGQLVAEAAADPGNRGSSACTVRDSGKPAELAVN